jgi:hypothetical protein
MPIFILTLFLPTRLPVYSVLPGMTSPCISIQDDYSEAKVNTDVNQNTLTRRELRQLIRF